VYRDRLVDLKRFVDAVEATGRVPTEPTTLTPWNEASNWLSVRYSVELKMDAHRMSL